MVVVEKIKKVFGDDLSGISLGILGLAFKPNTDDMRDAPSLTIIPELVKLGATITAFDPESMTNARAILGDSICYAENSIVAIQGADAMVLLTEWNDFRHLELAEIKKVLKKSILFDMRNVYDPEQAKRMGFGYYGIGRG